MKARFVLIALALAAAGSAHAQATVLNHSTGSDTTSATSLNSGSSVAVMEFTGMKIPAATTGTRAGPPAAGPASNDTADAATGPLTYGLMALGLIGMGMVAHRRNT